MVVMDCMSFGTRDYFVQVRRYGHAIICNFLFCLFVWNYFPFSPVDMICSLKKQQHQLQQQQRLSQIYGCLGLAEQDAEKS